MYFTSKTYFFIFIVVCFQYSIVFSQSNILLKSSLTTKPYKSGAKSFLVSYAIVVKGKRINGIAETYNGGVKTIFIKNNAARLRLVSLMRTQSIFFENTNVSTKKNIVIVKESGKERNRTYLKKKQWDFFNKKLDSLRCDILKDDTTTILNLLCAKAIITTKDSSKIEAYFYPSKVNKTLAVAEPLFAQVPGLVLKYIYKKGERSMEYTATNIKVAIISTDIFKVPSVGFKKIIYKPKDMPPAAGDISDDDDDATEEEETMSQDAPKTPLTDSLKVK